MLKRILSGKKKAKSWKSLMTEIEEAKKDPQWRKELKQFIKITTS
jgi:hypothetical protein